MTDGVRFCVSECPEDAEYVQENTCVSLCGTSFSTVGNVCVAVRVQTLQSYIIIVIVLASFVLLVLIIIAINQAIRKKDKKKKTGIESEHLYALQNSEAKRSFNCSDAAMPSFVLGLAILGALVLGTKNNFSFGFERGIEMAVPLVLAVLFEIGSCTMTRRYDTKKDNFEEIDKLKGLTKVSKQVN